MSAFAGFSGFALHMGELQVSKPLVFRYLVEARDCLSDYKLQGSEVPPPMSTWSTPTSS